MIESKLSGITTMNEQSQAGGANDEQQKMALLQSLLREADQQASFSKVSHQTQQPNLQGIPGMDRGDLYPLHSADQVLLQQRAIDNFAFGGMANNSQQQRLPTTMQGSDDLMLLRQQLQQQQQQLQLHQQHQLLLQAGGLAGAGSLTGFGGIGGGLGGSGFGGGNAAAGLLGPADGVIAGLSDAGRPRSGSMGSYGDMLNASGASGVVGQRSDSFPMALPPLAQTQRRSESFPVTLFRILVDLEVTGAAAQVAHFVAGGEAFLIKNAKIFEDKIIPKYFPRMGSFGSFQRQLNLYDFKRISQGPHRGAYNHPLFRRSCPHLARQMKRTKIKGLRKNFKKEQDEDSPAIVNKGPAVHQEPEN